MPVCNLAILDLVNLVVKWWKFGVIVASHSFMSNVDPGLQPVKLKNWSCLAAKINVPNLYHVVIGMNFKNIINSVLNGWPIREQYFEIWNQWSWKICYVLLQTAKLFQYRSQSPTSVVLTDRKRTAQILRAKTLRVLRQS